MSEFSKFFAVGDKVQLELVHDRERHQYMSEIEEIHPDGTFDILTPMYKNQLLILMNDAILKVAKAKDEAVFEVRARIVKKIFSKIPMIRLEIMSDISKIQRRNFFRLKVLKDTTARQVIDQKESKYGERFKGVMVDISGGGILLNSSEELHLDDIIEVTINLPIGRDMVVFGRIVRKNFNTNLKLSYSYGVKFEKISEFERNEIMKFIFEEQRKLRKKGLI